MYEFSKFHTLSYIQGLGGLQNFKKSIFFAYLIMQYV